ACAGRCGPHSIRCILSAPRHRNVMSFELKPVAPPRPSKIDLSVVLPIYDEEESLGELLGNLFAVLDGLNRTYEIWCVNDGSHDRSSEILHEIAKRRSELRVLDFRRNFGQTAALQAGFDHARGKVVVTLDADLQNDPADIPRLL